MSQSTRNEGGMNAYKSRLLAEARHDVGRALDIAIARLAVVGACVSPGYIRSGVDDPAEHISKAVTYADPDADTPDTNTAGE